MQSEALRDAFAEIDWTNSSASVRMSPEEPNFRIGVASPTGFAYEVWLTISCLDALHVLTTLQVNIPGDAAVFTEFDCRRTQDNEYNLNQLRHCVKALSLSASTGCTSIRMNNACMLSLQHMIEHEAVVVAFVDFLFLPIATIE